MLAVLLVWRWLLLVAAVLSAAPTRSRLWQCSCGGVSWVALLVGCDAGRARLLLLLLCKVVQTHQ